MIKKLILSIVFVYMTFFVGAYPVIVSVRKKGNEIKNPGRPRATMLISEIVFIPVSVTIEGHVIEYGDATLTVELSL